MMAGRGFGPFSRGRFFVASRRSPADAAAGADDSAATGVAGSDDGAEPIAAASTGAPPFVGSLVSVVALAAPELAGSELASGGAEAGRSMRIGAEPGRCEPMRIRRDDRVASLAAAASVFAGWEVASADEASGEGESLMELMDRRLRRFSEKSRR